MPAVRPPHAAHAFVVTGVAIGISRKEDGTAKGEAAAKATIECKAMVETSEAEAMVESKATVEAAEAEAMVESKPTMKAAEAAMEAAKAAAVESAAVETPAAAKSECRGRRCAPNHGRRRGQHKCAREDGSTKGDGLEAR